MSAIDEWQNGLMREVGLPPGWRVYSESPSLLRLVSPARPEDPEQEPEDEFEYVSTHIDVMSGESQEDDTFTVSDFEVQCSRNDPQIPQDRGEPCGFGSSGVDEEDLASVLRSVIQRCQSQAMNASM